MNVVGHSYNSNTLYCRAIENAGGVPFQLIFGSHVGEGHYSYVGTGIRKLLAIAPEEFSEKVFHEMIVDIIPPSGDIPAELSLAREKFLKGELKNYKAEIQVRLPGGERRWILDTSIPLIDEETGEVIGAVGILYHKNEHRTSLSFNESAEVKALENDFLKNAFLRNLSHEIRTPLNAIVGFSTLLNEPEKTSEERREITDILLRNTDHLLEIFTDIIEISNLEAGTVKVRKSTVNLNETLRRINDRFRIKASGKHISLRFLQEQDERNVNLVTDGYMLFQILTYLLDNAIKFTETGKVELGYSINDDIIKFYVSDTGIGVPTEVQLKIFSRFYQAESSSNRRFEGSGLGLSISKAYIELLSGEIWFTSQPGEGSVFYFTLPYEHMEV